MCPVWTFSHFSQCGWIQPCLRRNSSSACISDDFVRYLVQRALESRLEVFPPKNSGIIFAVSPIYDPCIFYIFVNCCTWYIVVLFTDAKSVTSQLKSEDTFIVQFIQLSTSYLSTSTRPDILNSNLEFFLSVTE